MSLVRLTMQKDSGQDHIKNRPLSYNLCSKQPDKSNHTPSHTGSQTSSTAIGPQLLGERAKTKTPKKHPQRTASSVFATFDQSQIQEFKEAFNMTDQNRDGFTDKEGLHAMLASLGRNPTDEYVDAMRNEAPGPISFTMFLTMFGGKLNGTNPEDVIGNAFTCLDEEATGTVCEGSLRELLTIMGDRFMDEDMDELYRKAPMDKKRNFNSIEFTHILKHGAKDKDDEKNSNSSQTFLVTILGISEIFSCMPLDLQLLHFLLIECATIEVRTRREGEKGKLIRSGNREAEAFTLKRNESQWLAQRRQVCNASRMNSVASV
ncbi:myosin regulatory light polypeptide 9-like [Aotus nancymaae]|uniref:myosin regulatory light polypeptide 9-like n=1 Tax=Aotus nancymaae TaxID=37293 RepID=UPI0030FEA585